jgi:DNA invertase Pin-like site-specific DNA recombinase
MSVFSKNACAYIRVSTDRQEELSPDAQKRLLFDYAKKNGLSLLSEDIYMDNGISGKKADKRPEFMRMIALAKSKEHPYDVILVWKFSRFARNQEESIVYKSLLKKNNVDVVSVSEPIIDGPFGTLIERIIEWMDEYYSIRLSGEVIRGMTEKALRGGYQGTMPMGYRMDKSTGIPYIYEDEAVIVRLIFNEYLTGQSYLEIARKLTSLGYRTRRSTSFEGRTVEYILQNPFYYGAVRWNRQNHDTHTIKDSSEWIIAMGKHEPLIDKDTWDTVQRMIAATKRPYKARAAGHMKHWLGGIVKCSSCGASLAAGLGATRYQCSGYNKGRCLHSHFIRTAALEQAVFSSFEDILNGTAGLEYSLRHVDNSESKSRADIIRESMEKLDIKEARIKQAYRDGIDTIEEYRDNKAILKRERDALEASLAECTPVSDTAENDARMLRNIASALAIIKDTSQDTVTRANAVRSVVDHFVYNKDTESLEIFFYLPDTDVGNILQSQ